MKNKRTAQRHSPYIVYSVANSVWVRDLYFTPLYGKLLPTKDEITRVTYEQERAIRLEFPLSEEHPASAS